MNALALMLLFVSADPVQVPVAGRPVDFSGAVGGPFEVKYVLNEERPEATRPFTFFVDIKGPGDTSQLRPFSLTEAVDQIAIDEVRPIRSEDNLLRLVYTVRFKSDAVILLPRLKLVYYSPAVRTFQTTYAEGQSLRVRDGRKDQLTFSPEIVAWAHEAERKCNNYRPSSLGDFLFQLNTRLDGYGIPLQLPSEWTRRDNQYGPWLLWLIPPAISVAVSIRWLKRTSRGNPYDLTVARLRDPAADPQQHIAGTLVAYLHQIGAVPRNCLSPTEVAQRLSPDSKLATVLRQCDAARFAPTDAHFDDLRKHAIAAVKVWEVK